MSKPLPIRHSGLKGACEKIYVKSVDGTTEGAVPEKTEEAGPDALGKVCPEKVVPKPERSTMCDGTCGWFPFTGFISRTICKKICEGVPRAEPSTEDGEHEQQSEADEDSPTGKELRP